MKRWLLLWLSLVAVTSRAQDVEQDITLHGVAEGAWEIEWPTFAYKTTFIQYSQDLVHWHYFPTLVHGADGQAAYGLANSDVRFFLRLRVHGNPVADPWSADFDGDLISNWGELSTWHTDPLAADSDGDGMDDGYEVTYGLNPNDASGSNGASGDPDADGVTNLTEYLHPSGPTNPTAIDTDSDDVPDALDAHPNESAIRWTRLPFTQYRAKEVGVPGTGGTPIDVNDRGDMLFRRHLWKVGEGAPTRLTRPGPTQYSWPVGSTFQLRSATLIADNNYPDDPNDPVNPLGTHWDPLAINNAGAIIGNARYTGADLGDIGGADRGVFWPYGGAPKVTTPQNLYENSATFFYDLSHDYQIIGADTQRYVAPERDDLVKWSMGARPVRLATFASLGLSPPTNVYAQGNPITVGADHAGNVLLDVLTGYDSLRKLPLNPGNVDYDLAKVGEEHLVFVDNSGARVNGTFLPGLAGLSVNRLGQVLSVDGAALWMNANYSTLDTWVTEEPNEPIWVNIVGHAISDGGTIAATGQIAQGPSKLLLLLPQYPATNFQASAEDATGPRYRKVALTGLPLSDEKPQATAESDGHKEETYLDAYTRQLSHHTSDIYIPLGGSELVLQVTRSYQEEIWNGRHGLLPTERYDRPFGACWTSSVCPHIEFVSRADAEMAVTVTDEEGRAQRFGSYNGVYYFPMPSGRVEKKTYLNTLRPVGGGVYEYKRKFGSTLRFVLVGALSKSIPVDRISLDLGTQIHRYARLTTVTDRLGNTLHYQHDAGNDSLVPNRIAAGQGRNQTITLTLESDATDARIKRVSEIKDPRGQITRFAYHDAVTQRALKEVAPPGFALTPAGMPATSLAYETSSETDQHPRAVAVPTRAVHSYHLRLASLTDAKSNLYQFAYHPDQTKQAYHTEAPAYHYQQTGLPSLVQQVTLPGGLITRLAHEGEAYFVAPPGLPNPEDTRLIIEDDSGQNVTAYKMTYVKDAAGNGRWYEFSGVDVINLKAIPGQQNPSDGGDSAELIVSYTRMDVRTANLGVESYFFLPAAGYALGQVVDWSGNATAYEYKSPYAAPPEFRYLASGRYGYFDDPSAEINALGQIKRFEYHPTHRVLSKVTEIDGSVTEYEIDGVGRRTKEIIKSAAQAILQETSFIYHPVFTGFITSKAALALGGDDPSWVEDRAINYVPDSAGRMAEEQVQAITGETPLTTKHGYDANGNRTSLIDPNQKTTLFEYDSRNRLIKVTYPDEDANAANNPFKEFVYDANGNKIGEKDEMRSVDNAADAGRWNLFVYDALNRLVAQGRDMNGNAAFTNGVANLELRSANTDLRTDYTYNEVGSVLTVTDPRDYVTTHTYDAMQRRTSTQTPHAEAAPTHVTTFFEYAASYAGDSAGTNRNSGASIFDISGFKPTRIVDARTYETLSAYDARYREVHRKTQYQLSPAKYAETETAYDDEARRVTQKEKVTTQTIIANVLTDVVTWLESETLSDALGRATQTTVAKGTTEEAISKSFYTSTGLLWKTEDALNRRTEMEYDQAGRHTLLFAPDPVSGLRTINSPITRTTYDANSNVIATTDPRGLQLSNGIVSGNAEVEKYTSYFQYDSRNRRVGTASPLITVTTEGVSGGTSELLSQRAATRTIYDAKGNVTAVVDPRGTTFTLVNGLLTVSEAANAASYKTTTVYDAADRPTTITPPAVPIFSALGSEVTPTGTNSLSEYDAKGNVIKVTDLNGNVTLHTYDPANRLETTKTHPSGTPQPGAVTGAEIRVKNEYDAVGNLTRVIDGLNQVTEFTYDGLNRKIAVIFDLGPRQDKTNYTFNEVYLTERKDDNATTGRISKYGYDSQKRLTTTSYVGRAGDDHTRVYDLLGNMESVTYATGDIRNVTYLYDKLNRVTQETSAGYTHGSLYDKAGNRTTLAYHLGRSVVSAYDGLNRLTTADDSTQAINATYGYDIASNRVALDLPNGTRTLASFDARNRQQRSTAWTPAPRVRAMDNRYAFDQVGNLKEQVERFNQGSTPAHNRVIAATYDNLYRLTNEQDYNVTFIDDTYTVGPEKREEVFVYDAAHNRFSKSVEINGSLNHSIAYYYAEGTHNSNQLSREVRTNPASTTTHDYDEYGNRKSSAGGRVESVVYDYENRIVSLTYSGVTSAYTSDYRARRVLRNEGTATTITYSGGTSAQEYQGATRQVEYVRGSDMGGGVGGILYSDRTSGGSKFFHYNQRGDVTAKTTATGASGNLDYLASYGSFGDLLGESGTNADPQGPNTKERGPHEVIHEGFRDRRDHVFYQRDPAGFVDGPNVYTYVRQNPWTKWDPHGLWEVRFFNIVVDFYQGKTRWADEVDREFLPGFGFDVGARRIEAIKQDPINFAKGMVGQGDGPSAESASEFSGNLQAVAALTSRGKAGNTGAPKVGGPPQTALAVTPAGVSVPVPVAGKPAGVPAPPVVAMTGNNPEGLSQKETKETHSKYPDGTSVTEGQQPGKITGPDPNAQGPHTVIKWDQVNGRIYKAREFGEGNIPVRDIDFTHPTYPNGKLRPNHSVPEQHPWIPNDPKNTKAGYKRGPGEPLQ